MVAAPQITTGMNSELNQIDSLPTKLKGQWKRRRFHTHLKGMLWILFCIPPVWLVLFGLDRILDLPRLGRWSFLLIALVLIGWQFFKRWFSQLEPFNLLKCASQVEKYYPQLGSLLINYVQINSPIPQASGSQELLGLVKGQAVKVSESIDFGKTVDFKDLSNQIKLTVTSVAVLLTCLLIFGDSMSVAVKRYLGFNLPYPTDTILYEVPDDMIVAQGTKFSLSVKAKGQVPENGVLHIRDAGSESWRQISLPRDDKKGFVFSINKTEESFDYYFEVGDAFSHSQREPGLVTVVSPPEIIKQTLQVIPPKYTGLASYEANNLSSTVPLGSKLTWVVSMSLPVSESSLTGPEDLMIPGQIQEKGKSVKFVWVANRAGVYQMVAREKSMGTNFQGQIHKLNLREDIEPRVSLISPVSDIKATSQKKLELLVRASDDYGLSEFAILYRVNGEKNRHRISLGAPPANDSQKDLLYPRSGTWPLLWNLQNDLPNLSEGDLIEIAVEVTEVAANHESARKALSRTCSVEILSVAEYQSYITTRFNDLQSDLAETERRELLIKHAIQASGNQ
jgi:hypothetical protein